MKTPLMMLCAALALTACGSVDRAPIASYRWHQSGMSESDVNRQQRSCRAQAQADAKHGKTPQSLEECMDRAGYYQIPSGGGNL
ncbi:protocatechuate 3,4-dioxygenase [Neisseria perflava]|uniref:protocatechuate 3,4-dioxygenase n=1 Tax=Neisseria perflava TaxID=33053 RepID=UPI0020A1E09F|nr:protocatechuate 3,4-dioxygenase [Neisseria perflava]MCP1659676.1 hypothetical protein [Neisseria perflava]MCP1771304.1 hypothetical protein [Neisseria perflava]